MRRSFCVDGVFLVNYTRNVNPYVAVVYFVISFPCILFSK